MEENEGQPKPKNFPLFISYTSNSVVTHFQEDNALLSCIREYGTTSWSRVSDSLRTRTGKQCR